MSTATNEVRNNRLLSTRTEELWSGEAKVYMAHSLAFALSSCSATSAFRYNAVCTSNYELWYFRENDETVTSVRFLASPADAKVHYMLVCYTTSIKCYSIPLRGEPKVGYDCFQEIRVGTCACVDTL